MFDILPSLENSDPRLKDYFLCHSPWPTFFIVSGYLLFVLKVGPAIMKNYQPFQLNKILMVYNVVQVLTNFWIFCQVLTLWDQNDPYCMEVITGDSPLDLKLIKLHYYYYALKLLDLVDTICIVLRKKNNQLSFLHVYHHAAVTVGAFVTFSYFPGGPLYFLGLFNTFVHVIMYSYYFLTSWKTEFKKYLTLKKAITQLQIIQFACCAVSFIVVLFNPNCGYPKTLLVFYCSQMFLMLYLFGDFYVKAYLTKPKQVKKQR